MEMGPLDRSGASGKVKLIYWGFVGSFDVGSLAVSRFGTM